MDVTLVQYLKICHMKDGIESGLVEGQESTQHENCLVLGCSKTALKAKGSPYLEGSPYHTKAE